MDLSITSEYVLNLHLLLSALRHMSAPTVVLRRHELPVRVVAVYQKL